VRVPVEMLSLCHIDPLFQAVVEATSEAILNAMLAAETMVGRDGVTAHALDGEALVQVLDRYGRRTAEPDAHSAPKPNPSNKGASVA